MPRPSRACGWCAFAAALGRPALHDLRRDAGPTVMPAPRHCTVKNLSRASRIEKPLLEGALELLAPPRCQRSDLLVRKQARLVERYGLVIATGRGDRGVIVPPRLRPASWPLVGEHRLPVILPRCPTLGVAGERRPPLVVAQLQRPSLHQAEGAIAGFLDAPLHRHGGSPNASTAQGSSRAAFSASWPGKAPPSRCHASRAA